MKFIKYLLLLLPILFIQCNGVKVKMDDLDFSETASGCGSFFVYKLNGNGKVGLVVRGNRDALGLTTQEQSFNLGDGLDLDVEVQKLNKNGNGFYCDDVIEQGEKILNTYSGFDGNIKIRITEDSISTNPWETIYKLDVMLENILLKDDDGNELEIESELFKDVTVGWLPG